MNDNDVRPGRGIEPTQLAFATMVSWVVRIGLMLLAAAFTIYVVGLIPSAVPIAEVPTLWHLDAVTYSYRTSHELGWAWISSLGTGDTLAFAALVLFPAGTMVVIAITAALYVRDRSLTYAWIALAEFLVLLTAASGILAPAH